MEVVNKILNKIQKENENKVTNTVIIPLLNKLGFNKVEFFGGQSEAGKDIIIWEEDRFGEITLRLAQVKHFKFSIQSRIISDETR